MLGVFLISGCNFLDTHCVTAGPSLMIIPLGTKAIAVVDCIKAEDKK